MDGAGGLEVSSQLESNEQSSTQIHRTMDDFIFPSTTYGLVNDQTLLSGIYSDSFTSNQTLPGNVALTGAQVQSQLDPLASFNGMPSAFTRSIPNNQSTGTSAFNSNPINIPNFGNTTAVNDFSTAYVHAPQISLMPQILQNTESIGQLGTNNASWNQFGASLPQVNNNTTVASSIPNSFVIDPTAAQQSSHSDNSTAFDWKMPDFNPNLKAAYSHFRSQSTNSNSSAMISQPYNATHITGGNVDGPDLELTSSAVFNKQNVRIKEALVAAFLSGVSAIRNQFSKMMKLELNATGTIFGLDFGSSHPQEIALRVAQWCDAQSHHLNLLEESGHIIRKIQLELEAKLPESFPAGPSKKPGSRSPKTTSNLNSVEKHHIPKSKVKQAFTLTGKSKILTHEGVAVTSYECSDGQYRLLSEEQVTEARRRTYSSISRIPSTVPSRANLNRKRRASNANETPSKKVKSSKAPTSDITSNSSLTAGKGISPIGAAISTSNVTAANDPEQTGNSFDIGSPSVNVGTVPKVSMVSEKEEDAIVRVVAASSASNGTRQPQQSIINSSSKKDELASVGDTRIGTQEKACIKTPKRKAKQQEPSMLLTKRTESDERFAKLLRIDPSFPRSIWLAYVEPSTQSLYPIPRAAAADDKIDDISNLLFNEYHRRQAIETYEKVASQRFSVNRGEAPEWNPRVCDAEKRTREKERIENGLETAVVGVENAAGQTALAQSSMKESTEEHLQKILQNTSNQFCRQVLDGNETSQFETDHHETKLATAFEAPGSPQAETSAAEGDKVSGVAGSNTQLLEESKVHRIQHVKQDPQHLGFDNKTFREHQEAEKAQREESKQKGNSLISHPVTTTIELKDASISASDASQSPEIDLATGSFGWLDAAASAWSQTEWCEAAGDGEEFKAESLMPTEDVDALYFATYGEDRLLL